MPTFILMTKLGPTVSENLKNREKKGQEWKSAVAKKCPGVKWIAHYALLGSYDFMDIYEAPDSETAAKVSMLTRSLGALSAESWTALPYGEFVEMIKDL
jgi:uncharacterized protein with GYD domain